MIANIEFVTEAELALDSGPMAVEIVRNGLILTVVDFLVSRFKNELTQIGEPFKGNEDNVKFIPLRKYFATALKYTLENDSPEHYDKFNILKKDVGESMELYYYDQCIVPKITKDIYKKFFIDANHPLLYSFLDDNDDYSLTNIKNGQYHSFTWENRISQAINPEKKEQKIVKDSPTLLAFAEMFKSNWTDDYCDRLSIIFSRTAIDFRKKQELEQKSISQTMKELNTL